MLPININIESGEKLIFNNLFLTNPVILSLSFCNTSMGSSTLTVFKKRKNTTEKFYLFKEVLVEHGDAFVAENLMLQGGFELYVSVPNSFSVTGWQH